MKSLITKLTVLLLAIGGFVSCDTNEYEPNVPIGRIETAGFEKDTFQFGEGAGKVVIPITASKYLNYSAIFQVEVTDGTAVEKTHFYIDSKESKMALGSSTAGIEMRIIDDTIINESRQFELTITSITGGAVANTKQKCVVIIRNDDYIPEAEVVFDNITAQIAETSGTLFIPFHLTKAAPAGVSVTFARGMKNSQTADENIHFKFKDYIKTVSLPEGVLNGQIAVDIIDNDIHEGDLVFDVAVRDVQGAYIGVDSLCRVTILDDDLDRTVTFNTAASYGEEAGTITIPMVIAGGADASRLVTGDIIVDSLFGCTAADFQLVTTNFSTAGDETINIQVNVNDNVNFGEWGFKLALRNLLNIKTQNTSTVVNIKDDERVLQFDTLAYSVDEGSNITIPIKMLGGRAPFDIPITVEVLTDGTTADASQYTMPLSYTKIYSGADNTSFAIATHQHSSRKDKNLRLRVSTTVGTTSPNKILASDTSICNITIVNTDRSIGFTQDSLSIDWFAKTVNLPLTLVGIDNAALVKVEATTSTGVSYTLNSVANTSTTVAIPGGTDSYTIPISIENITDNTKLLTLEITDVSGTGLSMSDVDPDGKKIVVYVDVLKKLNDIAGSQSTLYLYRQDNNLKESTGELKFTQDGAGAITGNMKMFFTQDVAYNNGYSTLTFDFTDNKLHLLLGQECIKVSSTYWCWKSRSTGSSGTYGTSVDVKFDVNVTTNVFACNTDGVLITNPISGKSSQGLMPADTAPTANSGSGLRIGTISASTGGTMSSTSANTNIRCMMIKKK